MSTALLTGASCGTFTSKKSPVIIIKSTFSSTHTSMAFSNAWTLSSSQIMIPPRSKMTIRNMSKFMHIMFKSKRVPILTIHGHSTVLRINL